MIKGITYIGIILYISAYVTLINLSQYLPFIIIYMHSTKQKSTTNNNERTLNNTFYK